MPKNLAHIERLATYLEALASDMSREEAKYILGLPSKYTKHILQSAFRRAILTHHPDISKSPDAAEKTRNIIWAYEMLRDTVDDAECTRLLDVWI